ncbi:MAG: T9SS type A sorting domain-containing protein [Patescibacteria group bacterium]
MKKFTVSFVFFVVLFLLSGFSGKAGAQILPPSTNGELFTVSLSPDSPWQERPGIVDQIPDNLKVMAVVITAGDKEVVINSLIFSVSQQYSYDNMPKIDQVNLGCQSVMLGSALLPEGIHSCQFSFNLTIPANSSKTLSFNLLGIKGDGSILPRVSEVKGGGKAMENYIYPVDTYGSFFSFVDPNKTHVELIFEPQTKNDTLYILPEQLFWTYGYFQLAPDNLLPQAINSFRMNIGLWNSLSFNQFHFTSPRAVDSLCDYDYLSRNGRLTENYLNDNYSLSWFSNDPEKGTSGYRFGEICGFNNLRPNETVLIPYYLETILYTPQFSEPTVKSYTHWLGLQSIDGIRGDINGNGTVNEKDVIILEDEYNRAGILSSELTFSSEGVNVGRGVLLFKSSVPSFLEIWLLRVYINNPDNILVRNLGIGELMSEHPIGSGTVVVPNSTEVAGDELTIKTQGFAVNVSGLFNGRYWAQVAQVINGQAVVKLPDANMKYKVEAISTLTTTDVETTENLPISFNLSQNYPNPFNPSTTISYSVPENSFVTLKVYDILGKEVAILVNEEKTVGNYQVNFDGSQLASGAYLCRLTANNFIQTKKMVLMK